MSVPAYPKPLIDMIKDAHRLQLNQDYLRKSRIASAVEHINDIVDTSAEVDAFIPGKRGPIDTVIELERYRDAIVEKEIINNKKDNEAAESHDRLSAPSLGSR